MATRNDTAFQPCPPANPGRCDLSAPQFFFSPDNSSPRTAREPPAPDHPVVAKTAWANPEGCTLLYGGMDVALSQNVHAQMERLSALTDVIYIHIDAALVAAEVTAQTQGS